MPEGFARARAGRPASRVPGRSRGSSHPSRRSARRGPRRGAPLRQRRSPGDHAAPLGRGFSYRSPNGETIRDRAEIARIAAIAIPPAWTQVWICPNPRGHILATGRDARGRKQYRYHPEWRALRDATKFDRMAAFAAALPAIRARLAADLALRGLPREKVLAAVVSIIDRTLIRVGNEEYARQNGSFGADDAARRARRDRPRRAAPVVPRQVGQGARGRDLRSPADEGRAPLSGPAGRAALRLPRRDRRSPARSTRVT